MAIDRNAPSTVNGSLLDAAVRHQIWLIRFGGESANKLIRILEDADRDLADQIERRIERLGPLDRQEIGRGRMTTRRLRRLQQALREQASDLREAMQKSLSGDLKDLAPQEIDIAARRLQEAMSVGGASVEMLRPSPEVMRTLTENPQVRGRTLRQWFTKLRGDRLRLINQAVTLGIVESETSRQISNRVKDAVRVNRRSADALARTAVNDVANQSRQSLYRANDDIVRALKWTSVLDGRTSNICIFRDGRVRPVVPGESIGDLGPKLMPETAAPPAHPNCRSVLTPITRSWGELTKPGALKRERDEGRIDELFHQKLREQGFGDEEIKRIFRNQRASMNGQVPDSLTYQEWLSRQPRQMQDEVLGVSKARLFRKGELPLDKFVDRRTGKPFTLDDLKRRESEAWARADLPE